ncbi:MAG: glycoside hydrolase family 3 C-terminal domain-containing protein [Butyrivibrio sp.]|nr:glycoside hydrolase family 3 C-terminal domain-containing protein [Butyrivibrio sp.]
MVFGATQKEPTELEKRNRQLARRAAAEGFVLLENNGVLPLKPGKIALYGSGARMTVKGGTGSGAVRERYSVSIEEGLKDAGYEITTTDWLDRFDAFYQETYKKYEDAVEKKVKGIQDFYRILGMAGKFDHPTGIPITDGDVKNSGVDTAVYVLARQAGEGDDRRDVQGDYRLDDVERENLRKAASCYKNLVVVVNAGGVIDVSFLDEIPVAALVYYVQGGEEGGNALADVLSGKVNFSGKLATGWAYDFSDIPSNTTYSYLGKDKYNQEYNEGIYVGYRYFDTFGVQPRYHFGYGLSYTEFAMETGQVCIRDAQVTAGVMVKNTGSRPGREVVQLYGTVPFGSGAEYQRLLAFVKTKELAPGESVTVKLRFGLRDLAVYEEKEAAYVLREGQHILRAGSASHQTKPVAVLTLEEDVTVEKCTNICPVQHKVEEIVPPERRAENLDGVPVVPIPVSQIEPVVHAYPKPPVFTEKDTETQGGRKSIRDKVESLTLRQLATLVCGGYTKGKRIVNALGASGSTTGELYEECGIPNAICSDGPAGLNLTSQIVEMPDGSVKAARVPENLEAYKRYLFGFAKVALTSQMAEPGEGTVHYQYATAWPCSQLLAQSFDTELLEEIGDAVGREMEEYGITVWLAPGMNIHRNPLCGRTFEYYSEDPLVSGKMAAAIVRGVQSHEGKGMSVKHFAANNCELERNSSSSNVNERALREIYLKGFEIAVKESKPMTVMASYNMVNGVYATNSYDLLVKVLRNEWGFEGLVMSDWDSLKADREDCLKAVTGDITKAHQAQCDLIMPGRPDQIEALVQAVEQGLVDVEDLKRSAGRILNMVRKNTFMECE